MRVARQVQALVTGFAEIAKPSAVAASIAIVPPSPLGSTTNAQEVKAYLQQRAQPAQILLASVSGETAWPAAYRTQALSSLEQRVQLSELLWRNKDRAAAAAVKAHTRATKLRPLTTPASAPTGMEEVARTSLAEASRDLLGKAELAFGTLQNKVHVWISQISLQSVVPSGSFLYRHRHRWIGPVAAFAALVVVFLLIHRRSPTAAPGLVPLKATTPSAGTAPVPAAAVSTEPNTPPVAAVPQSPPKPVATSEKHGPTRPEPGKKAKTDEEPERPAREHGGLSSEQTRQVLSRGQTQLDRGCYTLAIDYFRRVLADDPHNPSASSGIEKARRRMELDSAPKDACK